jgi:hypothetical protein
MAVRLPATHCVTGALCLLCNTQTQHQWDSREESGRGIKLTTVPPLPQYVFIARCLLKSREHFMECVLNLNIRAFETKKRGILIGRDITLLGLHEPPPNLKMNLMLVKDIMAYPGTVPVQWTCYLEVIWRNSVPHSSVANVAQQSHEHEDNDHVGHHKQMALSSIFEWGVSWRCDPTL